MSIRTQHIIIAGLFILWAAATSYTVYQITNENRVRTEQSAQALITIYRGGV